MPDPSTSAAPALTASLIVHDDFSHIGLALKHLYVSTARPLEVVVTINRGLPDEVHKLRAQFPDAQLIINQAPRGFAANHNAVMQSAETPLIVLLNDDALLSESALEKMVAYLEMHSDVAMVGPVIRKANGDLQVSTYSDPTLLRMLYQVSGLGRLTPQGGCIRRLLRQMGVGRFARVESLQADTSTHDAQNIVGVCMVVRREAMLQVGVMDEVTRIYGEEFGWQWRLRQKGWRIALVGDAEVTHLNPAQDLRDWRLAEHRKGMVGYFLRYRPKWQTLFLRAAITVFHGAFAVLWLPFNRRKSRAHRLACRVGIHPA